MFIFCIQKNREMTQCGELPIPMLQCVMYMSMELPSAYVHVIVVVLALFFLVRACVDAFSFFMLSPGGEKSPLEYIASKRALQDQALIHHCGLRLVRIDSLLQKKRKEGRHNNLNVSQVPPLLLSQQT
jgi:hypothetical protein